MATTPTTTIATRPLLGASLLQDGWITQEQLDLAVRESKRKGVMLGQALIGLGFLTEKVLAHYLAEGTQTGLVDLSNTLIPPEILDLVPYDIATQFQVLPIGKQGNVLNLAMADPLNIVAVDTMKAAPGSTSTLTPPQRRNSSKPLNDTMLTGNPSNNCWMN